MTGPSTVLGLVTGAWGARGGIAAVTRDLATALADDPRIDAVHLLPREAAEPARDLPPGVTQAPPLRGRLAYAFAAWREANRLRPAIVYCNHLYMAPLAALLARRMHARLLVHLHGIEIWQTPTRWRRMALEAADLLLCVSRDTRRRALAAADLPPERAIVLSNTFGPAFRPGDRQAARTRLGVDGHTALLSVGRIDSAERYKGHDLVIPALPALASGRPDLLYLVAGDGSDRPRLEALVRQHGVAERVRFLGHTGDGDLPDLYRAADLFVLPSAGEGFGVAFVEAMACGTPAVGLGIGGATDALGDGALGTIATSEDLTQVLARLLDAPRPDGAELAARVGARFGRAAYRSRVAAMLRLAFGEDSPLIRRSPS